MKADERFSGCLLGTALGDSLLLPAEGLSRARIARRFRGPVRQSLVCGLGLVSDDTEHAFLTAQALLACGDDAPSFARALAFRLRWWLLSLPAGCGKATVQGLIRSWIGFPPARSGVFSAGNGPAMRSAIIGLRWGHDPPRLHSFVAASTTITHSDERALTAALAVAHAAATISRGDPEEMLWTLWRGLSETKDWLDIVDAMERQHRAGAPIDRLAGDLGCEQRVSGFAFHSVPIALYAWLHHRHDPQECMNSILRCGGDTDTIGAIAGALLGADGGKAAFPATWLAKLAEWPLSAHRLEAAGYALARGDAAPVSWWWPLQPLRNLVFIAIIMMHIVRRWMPDRAQA